MALSHSKRRRQLAAVIATGEPVLSKKGKLKNATSTNGPLGESGVIQKLAKKNRKRTQWKEVRKPRVDYWETHVLSGMQAIISDTTE